MKLEEDKYICGSVTRSSVVSLSARLCGRSTFVLYPGFRSNKVDCQVLRWIHMALRSKEETGRRYGKFLSHKAVALLSVSVVVGDERIFIAAERCLPFFPRVKDSTHICSQEINGRGQPY